MQNRTENHPHAVAESDEIRVTRPDWLTSDDSWEHLKEEITRGIDEIVKDVVGTPPPADDCGRAWCTMTGQDHRGLHASDPVTLVGDTEDESETEWHGWLTQPDGDTLIDVVIEGHHAPSTAALDFTVPVWQLVVLRDVFEDPAGCDRLSALMTQAAEEPA